MNKTRFPMRRGEWLGWVLMLTHIAALILTAVAIIRWLK
jgi:hypothetical protein